MPQLRATEEAKWRAIYALLPGMSSAAAAQEIKFLCDYRAALISASHGLSTLRTQFSSALLVLMGGVGLLLLAVCANISGLLLAKAAERKQELAVRLSVGASPARLARQFFTENLLLAIPGAMLGIFLAFALSPALVSLLPSIRGLVPL